MCRQPYALAYNNNNNHHNNNTEENQNNNKNNSNSNNITDLLEEEDDDLDLFYLGDVLDYLDLEEHGGLVALKEGEEPNIEELMELEEQQEKDLFFLPFDEPIQQQTYSDNNEIIALTTNINSLEKALLEGVVPAQAQVGCKTLPGDYGFDPLNLAIKDYMLFSQLILKATFNGEWFEIKKIVNEPWQKRPAALILRDYREAEVRHGRLAMLAVILWPLQEIIDRILIPTKFGDTTIVYGGITLPYLSLSMTLFMLLLGYLDIYSEAIKEAESGEAFLPGECFWDPLSILNGASQDTKQNFQRKEIQNGRLAMIAFVLFAFEEGLTHKPLITLPFNQFFFEPFYEVPRIQQFLDQQFGYYVAAASSSSLSLVVESTHVV